LLFPFDEIWLFIRGRNEPADPQTRRFKADSNVAFQIRHPELEFFIRKKEKERRMS